MSKSYEQIKDVKVCNCPSCGAHGKLRYKNRTYIDGKQVRNCYIYCPECDFRGPRVLYSDYPTMFDAHVEAIRRWNRRV